MVIVVDQKVEILQEIFPKDSLDVPFQGPELALIEGVDLDVLHRLPGYAEGRRFCPVLGTVPQ